MSQSKQCVDEGDVCVNSADTLKVNKTMPPAATPPPARKQLGQDTSQAIKKVQCASQNTLALCLPVKAGPDPCKKKQQLPTAAMCTGNMTTERQNIVLQISQKRKRPRPASCSHEAWQGVAVQHRETPHKMLPQMHRCCNTHGKSVAVRRMVSSCQRQSPVPGQNQSHVCEMQP
jgi:hypothetical protein